MPRRYPLYRPPPLTLRVWVRDRLDRPDGVDEFETDPDAAGAENWGVRVWAAKRDRSANFQSDEAVAIYAQQSVFTIRARDGVAADAEVVYDGNIYVAQGEPLARGHQSGGARARFLEIITELRQ